MALLGFWTAKPVWAHANLYRSDPPANAVLTQSPAEIRLWFTEPVEPEFSRFALRDTGGKIVDAPSSQVDPADSAQLVMRPPTLPNGLYTVTWRVVSTTDGHETQGSFPFSIGIAANKEWIATFTTPETIPVGGTLIRWANLLSLAMTTGGLGFLLFVWSPSVPAGQAAVERRMNYLIKAGWVALGLTGGLSLLFQVSVAADVPLFKAVTDSALKSVVTNTRFGHLWIVGMIFWGELGVILVAVSLDRGLYWVALALGVAMLITSSLVSHASSAQDVVAAVAAEGLHLVAAALWFGGLVQFINVIGPVRRHFTPAAPVLSTLIGYFSNFARVAVAILLLTGFYTAWVQIGDVKGLFTTTYGQALLVKLMLIGPLLGIAGINLVFTHRGLQSGREIWGSRLRGLVGAEVFLATGVLAAVGVMISAPPTRGVLALRAAAAANPNPTAIDDTATADDLTVHLHIAPGWVGDNTFVLSLSDPDGNPVEDASLIRLRFQSQTENVGQSELRPTHQGSGVYAVSGSNLSLPGSWRIRMTVQRPHQYDVVVDFSPNLRLPPPSTTTPMINANAPLRFRTLILLSTGFLALGIAGFHLGRGRWRMNGSGLLLAGLGILGIILVVSGTLAVP
jgi:copper transport protein